MLVADTLDPYTKSHDKKRCAQFIYYLVDAIGSSVISKSPWPKNG